MRSRRGMRAAQTRASCERPLQAPPLRAGITNYRPAPNLLPGAVGRRGIKCTATLIRMPNGESSRPIARSLGRAASIEDHGFFCRISIFSTEDLPDRRSATIS